LRATRPKNRKRKGEQQEKKRLKNLTFFLKMTDVAVKKPKEDKVEANADAAAPPPAPEDVAAMFDLSKKKKKKKKKDVRFIVVYDNTRYTHKSFEN
jgi:hypothetical protein